MTNSVAVDTIGISTRRQIADARITGVMVHALVIDNCFDFFWRPSSRQRIEFRVPSAAKGGRPRLWHPPAIKSQYPQSVGTRGRARMSFNFCYPRGAEPAALAGRGASGSRRQWVIVSRSGGTMNPVRALKLAVLLVGALAAHVALADSWAPATTERYVSADGAWRLTVEPRAITSPLAYFQDQVDGMPSPGGVPGSRQTSARGTMERRINGAWQRIWQRPMRNNVAPVDVIVLPGGAALTLDNWHSMGFGSDAVVLYDQQGTDVAAYALTDFLPEDYVRALPRSVSSLDWRGEAKALPDGKRVVVPVVVPSPDDDDKDAHFFPVTFDVAAGKVEPPKGSDWDHAVAAAQQAREKQLADEADERRRFIEPLQAPAVPDERSWHNYLVEAFFRLDPEWDDGYPATTVLRLPGARDYRASEKWVHEALWDEVERDGVTMFASLSQDALLERIEAEANGMKVGMLSQARIYLVLDSARFARAEGALKKSGAVVIQIDPATPIPQRPARLERYLEGHAESDD